MEQENQTLNAEELRKQYVERMKEMYKIRKERIEAIKKKEEKKRKKKS